MHRSIVPGLLIAFLVVTMLTAASFIHPVKATGTIYIRADGSIEPADAPISATDNFAYILTGNITSDGDGIVVGRNNVVIDGSGYTIQGTGVFPYRGINLTEKSNVMIKNINLRAFWTGINLASSSNNTISGSSVIGITTADGFGIRLGSFSSNNTICGNVVTHIEWGIELGRSSDNNLTRNNVEHCWGGIKLGDSPNNTLTRNRIANNQIGIEFMNSSNNTLYHNSLVDNMARQAYVYSYVSNNVWDNGYPSGGNYWSDYVGVDVKSGLGQDLPGGDGIGDTPYAIDENYQDNYPIITGPEKPKRPGDVNGDGVVAISDAVLAAASYGSMQGDPKWNPDADLAPQYGRIDILDLVTVAGHYGERAP